MNDFLILLSNVLCMLTMNVLILYISVPPCKILQGKHDYELTYPV